jgi:hypothetical protein
MAEISNEMYDEFRRILERHYGIPCSLEEAKIIGDGLIDFFSLLIELDDEKSI